MYKNKKRKDKTPICFSRQYNYLHEKQTGLYRNGQANPKIHMELKGTQNSYNGAEKEENGRTPTS